MNAIEFAEIWKQYHKREFFFAKSDLFWAIRGISFSVKQGETVSIIGPNGAGKTTIIKLISKIIYPTKGALTVKGRVVPLITMESCLNPLLNVRENVFLLISVFGLKKQNRERAFEDIIAFSGLKEFLEMPIKKFSGGMCSRLSFSIAIHMPSDILVIDEILAVGDQEFQEKCFRKIGQFKKEGKTIIFVSHNMNDVRGVSDRAIWVDHGTIREEGATDTVVTSYLTAKEEY
ncbi:MAG: ATP-binding cassette domain-containing protein [Candidatus Omnitrophica bacterium]|nr:ATP-binding cassette domain-containing protein [Candidatus Omnitrophota bacterium]MBU4488703.1 ATP-binding cassette domain-containing protein [Candidatus Omnitrophota bacterium]MCG2705732.1 ATP-binding cassette domain-containing protein [Candidatus Omnitrophota bacterium]